MKAFLTKTILAMLFIFMSCSAKAVDFSECREVFYGRISPTFINESLAEENYPLCFDGFAVMYSGVTKTPLWSAEFLTSDRLEQARELPRDEYFHIESQLPKSVQADLEDYVGSGYDRGHLAPNADMANINQQYDSFSLANIVPQNSYLNRNLWRELESITRYLTYKYGEVYVVSGVVFAEDKVKLLNNSVMVPSHMYKAVYIPQLQQSGVYYVKNDASISLEVISVQALKNRVGVDVIPALDIHTQQQKFDLPVPESPNLQSKADDESDNTQENWLLRFVVKVFIWLVDNMSQE